MPLIEDKAAGDARQRSTTRLLTLATLGLCLIAVLTTFTSRVGVRPPEYHTIFARLFAFNDFAGSLAMLAALLLALAVPGLQRLVSQLAVWMGDHPAKSIAAAFVLLALCSRFVYLAHPLSMDEYAPWMQANAFAEGNLTAQYPLELLDVIVPRQFQGFFFAVDRTSGEVISKYLPGLALMMTPFVWLKLGWCLNPAFAALALMMIYRLASEVAGSRTAGGWAILIALASPQFTVNAISFYAMTSELALNLLFLWLLLKPDIKWAFAAGLVGGLSLSMHNPAPHALMALPCLVWLAWDRGRWLRLAAVAAGYLPLVVTLVVGWSTLMATMESAGTSGAVFVHRGFVASTLSFVASILSLPDYDTLVARAYATWKLWIWACPGLLLVLLLPRARATSERLLIAALAITWLFFVFIRFDQGHGWGYRYLHPAWAALPVAGGLWAAAAMDRSRQWAGTMVAAGLLATPVFMWQTHGTIANALTWRQAPQGKGDWVIFISQDTGRYRGDLVQNPPGQAQVLYLVSHGHDEDLALVRRHFPGAVEAVRDERGSSWSLPPGRLAEVMRGDADGAGDTPE